MPARLLIVDDQDSFRLWARRLLEAEGYDVVGEAHDGRSALAAVHELQPEVVLLDIQLPDTNGFDLAESLVRLPGRRLVILTSAHDVTDYRCRLGTCGAVGFIPKAELSRAALEMLLLRPG